MIINMHHQRLAQVACLKGKVLLPLRIQVSMDNSTSILEGGALELDIRVATSWRGGEGEGIRVRVWGREKQTE